MRRIFIGTLVVLTIALINGCANRKITRVDPNKTIDLKDVGMIVTHGLFPKK